MRHERRPAAVGRPTTAASRTAREKIGSEETAYPATLAQLPKPPQELYVIGGVERLQRLLATPAVAIVGARGATDYGMETARGLARGLAASGVTVIGGLAEGIAAAAHSGALEVEGPTLTVMPGGADVCYPATRRALWARLCEIGCAISEHAWGTAVDRWSHPRRTRIVVALARLVVVVEAEARGSALAPARLAQKLGRTVAAVPGRVSSPLSAGPHALLAEGACLVRDAEDALDALYGVGARHSISARHGPARSPASSMPPLLRAALEQVAGGRDTLPKLLAAGHDPDAVILALAELELSGALVRGDGGRYLPRTPPPVSQTIPAGG